MKKPFYIIIFISLLSIHLEARESNNKAELNKVCLEALKAKKNFKSDTSDYCNCWSTNIASVPEVFQKTVLKYYNKRITAEEFDFNHNTLANFELSVAEKCVASSAWRKKSYPPSKAGNSKDKKD